MTLKQARQLIPGDKIRIQKHTKAVIKAMKDWHLFPENPPNKAGTIYTFKELIDRTENNPMNLPHAINVEEIGYEFPIRCISKVS